MNESIILIGDVEIAWSDVVKFKNGHVYGEDIFSWTLFIGPRYSSGKDTYVELTSGMKYHLFFENYTQQIQFVKIVKDQYRRGNLKLNIVYDGLALEYEEIQNLKKSKSM